MLKLFPVFVFLAALWLEMFSACSNSEYVDEYDMFVSDSAFDEVSQDSIYVKDTLTDFPPSGFYPGSFIILFPDDKTLNCAMGGAEPTLNSPALKNIRVDSSSVIRCVDFSTTPKTEIVRTYIFEKKPTIPVMFITTDPNSLFNPDTGIYMEGPNAGNDVLHQGANYWLDKEIPIFIELTEADAYIPAFSKYAGLKIFGNFSRTKAKKSVAITFREEYGEKRLNYMLFPEFPNLKSFKSFVLRNFGSRSGTDYIRDRLASSISEGLNVDYQRGRCVVAYYNGKYFGIHDMRERSNEYYFETHYGMNHKNINLLKADNSVSVGSSDDYVSLMNWIKDNNLENEENYAYIASKIDIDNYINYMQVEMFAYNHDWPGNNLKKWNCTNPQTRWKWFLYDLDVTFGQIKEGNNLSNVFEYVLTENSDYHDNKPKYTFLFRSFFKNEKFRTAFINRMLALLQMNFESSRVLAQIEKKMNEIEVEIPRDQKRWLYDSSKMAEQLEIVKRFVIDRPSIIVKDLQVYFKLNEIIPITLSVNGNGNILVHNLPLDGTPLTISFFKGFPVTLTAEPHDGSSWSHWSDGDTSATRIILPNKAQTLMAIFK